MKLLKSNKSLITGNKGQVALFVALIFQVLFLFFAMIVNVGLVVHHKINLQSSVDMAAYYGAMKQAELLNSIAHINYQMRQSWKLLAWRYRVLGSAGDESRHPYSYRSRSIVPQRDVEYSDDSLGNFTQPPFCITYEPFNETIVPPGESTCKQTLSSGVANQVVRLFKAPPVIAGFIGMASATKAITENMRRSAIRRCENIGIYNYLILGNFMLSYQIDQNARRTTIARISKDMSKNKKDFFDIDGQSVRAGAFETFKRNLTEANKESDSLNFEMYNGLAHEGCGTNPVGNTLEYPAPWLSENRIFPSIYYLDMECEGNATRLPYRVKNFELKLPSQIRSENNADSIPWAYLNGRTSQEINQRIEYVATYLNLYSDNYRFILGYEKNPWCQAYVGAKATSNPKIPFAPSDLKLTATAFAKPFGGRIGPWYYKTWNKGTPESSGSVDDRTDPMVPLKITDRNVLLNDPNLYGSPLRIANHSKYIGDQFGLKSWRTLAHFTRALFSLSPKGLYRSIPSGTSLTDLKIISSEPDAPRLEDWNHVALTPDLNPQKDILAWNEVNDKESGMRMLEIAGIAPDQFDLAYYSIEPNFYDNYYNRLKNGIFNKIGLDESFLRPDLGARIGHQVLESFSVKDQIKTVKDITQPVIDFKNKLTYAVLNPVHVLTSWSNKTLFDYEEAADGYFGACQSPLISKNNYTDPQANTSFLKKRESVPGECVTGGRTGYSVKIISKDVLFSPVRAGGAGTAESIILNPPTDF